MNREELVRELGFSKASILVGVNPNTLRVWCIRRGIPSPNTARRPHSSDFRETVIQDARALGARRAAKVHRVSRSTVWRWLREE